jgi:hypothetical protein
LIDPILKARSALVRKYPANRALFPDGIGSWYRFQEWTDAGVFVGSGQPPGTQKKAGTDR